MLKQLINKNVYLDANPIIYFLNGNEIFFSITRALFQMIDTGQVVASTGDLCLAELLVKPTKDNKLQEIDYIKEIFEKEFIQLLAHKREVFLLASSIRARSGLKMIDAIHVATAVYYQCDVFITGDIKIVNSIKEIEILNLNSLIHNQP